MECATLTKVTRCSCILEDEDTEFAEVNVDDCCPIHGTHSFCDCEHDKGQTTCEICLNHTKSTKGNSG